MTPDEIENSFKKMRNKTEYRDRVHWQAPKDYGVSVDKPVAGYYRMRLRSGGVPVGIKIWHGPPHDPVTGEELDRSWRWQSLCNDEPIDFERVWPVCANEPITEKTYNVIVQRQAWAREHAPQSTLAEPKRKPNHFNSPLYF